MSQDVFNQIAEGLKEAIAVSKGETQPYKLHVPAELDVKSIRAKSGMTQKDFSSHFGFGLDQLKQWEQGRARPIKAMRAYLLLIERNPEQILELLSEIQEELQDAEEAAGGELIAM